MGRNHCRLDVPRRAHSRHCQFELRSDSASISVGVAFESRSHFEHGVEHADAAAKVIELHSAEAPPGGSPKNKQNNKSGRSMYTINADGSVTYEMWSKTGKQGEEKQMKIVYSPEEGQGQDANESECWRRRCHCEHKHTYQTKATVHRHASNN